MKLSEEEAHTLKLMANRATEDLGVSEPYSVATLCLNIVRAYLHNRTFKVADETWARMFPNEKDREIMTKKIDEFKPRWDVR